MSIIKQANSSNDSHCHKSKYSRGDYFHNGYLPRELDLVKNNHRVTNNRNGYSHPMNGFKIISNDFYSPGKSVHIG